MRYYSVNLIDDYPSGPFMKIKSIAHFYEGEYFDEIGMNVRGYIEYEWPLCPDVVEEYGFIVPADRVKFLEYIRSDSWGREIFEDENGVIWKYATPGKLPRMCHDVLYNSSDNTLDGEPDHPMSSEFDYRVIE